jgi:hypothetical protein
MGFGNAIVLPQAVAFVSAVIDALADASLKIIGSIDPIAAQVCEKNPSPSSAEQVSVVMPAVPPWTGPNAGETAPSGMLYGRVPGERWPHGPPSAHEPCCNLFPHRGSPGGLFCDCAASAIDDVENGVCA